MASIQALSSAVLDTAKIWIRRRTTLHSITFFCAAAGLLASGGWLYILALLAVVSEAGAWSASLAAQGKKALGQELLRLNILKQAFGAAMAVDASYLKARVSRSDSEKAKRFERENYYATRKDDAEARLVEIIQESCFWSHHLYTACRNRSATIALVLLVIVVLAVIVSLSLMEVDEQYTAPRLALLFMVFFPIWDEAGKALAFNSASHRLELIDHRLSAGVTDTGGVLAIFADYNVVTSTAPLIPQVVYDNEQDRLNTLWSERCTGQAPTRG